MKLTISWQAPNTDTWELDYPCPICRLETTVTLGQLRQEEYIICRGCHSTIKLIDQLGGVQHLWDTMRTVL
ncbi:MAG: hypothetical protein M5U05_18750 [Anaerolineales bacterium]|nr:hypothetical protein [Anaerolineales bacterium]